MSGRAMDAELCKLKKWRKPIVKDGACLFRCVSEFFKGTQQYHLDYRRQCLEYIQKREDHYINYLDIDVSFPEYMSKMALASSWAGHIELDALSNVFDLKFTIFRELPVYEIDKEFEPPAVEEDTGPLFRRNHIEVCYAGNNHYDIALPLRYRDTAEWVQGLVYDLVNAALKLPLSQTHHRYRDPEYETWRREREVREVEGFSAESYHKMVLEEEGWDVAGKGGKKKAKRKGKKNSATLAFHDFGGGGGGDDAVMDGGRQRGRAAPPRITDDPSSFPSLGGRSTQTVQPSQPNGAAGPVGPVAAAVPTPVTRVEASMGGGVDGGGSADTEGSSSVWGVRKNWGTAFQPPANGMADAAGGSADVTATAATVTAATPTDPVAPPPGTYKETVTAAAPVFKRPAWAPTPVLPDAAVCHAEHSGGCARCAAGTCSVGAAVAAKKKASDVVAAITAAASIAQVLQASARQQAEPPVVPAAVVSQPTPGGTGVDAPQAHDWEAKGEPHGEPHTANTSDRGAATEEGEADGIEAVDAYDHTEPYDGMGGAPHLMGSHGMGPGHYPMDGGVHYHNGLPFMMTPQGMCPVQFVPGPNGQMMAAPMPYYYPPQGMMMGHHRSGDDQDVGGSPYGGQRMMHYPHMQQQQQQQQQQYGGYYGHQPHMYQPPQHHPPQ